MKLRNQKLKYNLQFFADKGDAGQAETDNSGNDGDDDQDEGDQDDDQQKKSDKKGKYLTQDEINQIIEERLKRERKKLQKQQSKDDKQNDKGSDDAKDENAKKLSDLEMKVLCYDHDIAKEYVKEAIAIAKAYVDEDTDMDEALEMVVKKFPQFVKGYDSKKKDSDEDEDEGNNKGAWGQRQKGTNKKIDAVEAAFLAKNPGLKID